MSSERPEIRPLRFAIDTMEITFAGTLDPIAGDALEPAKKRAQVSDTPEPITIGGVEFMLQPKGRPRYGYVLRSEHLLVSMNTGAVYPQMIVRLLSEGLVAKGAEALSRQARTVGAHFGLMPLGVSRLDMALDFQGWAPTFEEMQNVLCLSPFRPVYPSTDRPETFQFGKRDVVVRLYNKSREILVKHKEWWRFVWRTIPNYIEAEDVWRIEVQLRTNALRALSARSVEVAISGADLRFDWALDEFCSLRLPSETDSNKRRWREHPLWSELRRSVWCGGDLIGRVRPAKVLVEYTRLVSRQLGLIASAGATIESDDYWHVARVLTTDAEALMREREVEFAKLVEKRRRDAV